MLKDVSLFWRKAGLFSEYTSDLDNSTNLYRPQRQHFIQRVQYCVYINIPACVDGARYSDGAAHAWLAPAERGIFRSVPLNSQVSFNPFSRMTTAKQDQFLVHHRIHSWTKSSGFPSATSLWLDWRVEKEECPESSSSRGDGASDLMISSSPGSLFHSFTVFGKFTFLPVMMDGYSGS